MKIVKRLLIIFGVLIVLLLGAAVLIPIVFKDKLTAIAKEQINANLRAEVDFGEVDVSFLRSFPRVSLAVDSFSVVGVDTFAGLPLARGTSAAFALDLWSVIRNDGTIRIKSVDLVDPFINILVLPNGMANYDVAIVAEEEQPDTTTSEANFDLEAYSVTNGRLVYDDRLADTYLELRGLDHTGSGNFTLEEFDLDTQSEADTLILSQGGITYLNNARALADAVLTINTAESRYTFKDNDITINDLPLRLDGWLAVPTEDVEMDLTFSSPDTDFKALWSIIPAAYTQGYENVQATGQFRLAGTVKGTYGLEPERYPAFQIQAAVQNGNVKYPDLPLGIQNISADIDVNSPSQDLNDMVVKVSDLSLLVGNDPFKARMVLTTPIKDPAVDADIDGIIDLAQWAKAFPMEGLQELTGRIVADVSINTTASAIEAQDYDRVRMSGELSATGINYQAEGLPPVRIAQAVASFNPQSVAITQFNANLGRSDISATGTIDNILAYVSPEKTMRGNFVVRSNFFDAGEWVTEEEPARAATPAELAAANETPATEVFDRFDFTVDAVANEIVYDTYTLENSSLTGRIQPNRMRIDNMSTTIGQSSFQGSGTILNAFDYTFDDGILGGQLAVSSGFLNLNDFMAEDENAAAQSGAAADEALAPIPVPKNVNVSVDLRADRVQYTDIMLNNVRGRLAVRDEQVIIEDGNAALLGGTMGFAGSYDAQNLERPGFSFKYDLQSLDFQQAFGVLNTFQALAPIGKFINGNFSSNMIIEGNLGQNMMPLLGSIDAEGFLATANAALNSFKPLQAVGNLLRIEELQNTVNLRNVKSWFSIQDGTVNVAPFDVKIADAVMTISGKHGLSQDMDYKILAEIPRKLLEGNFVGAAVGRGVDQLLSQANKLGLNLQQSDTVNVQINLAGSISDPKVGLNLLGATGAGSGGDGIVEAGKQQLEQQKQALEEEFKENVSETKTAIREEAKSTADSLRRTAEQAARDKLREAAGLPRDTTRTGTPTDPKEQVKESVKDIRENLDKFNPFKKKQEPPKDTVKSGG